MEYWLTLAHADEALSLGMGMGLTDLPVEGGGGTAPPETASFSSDAFDTNAFDEDAFAIG